MTDHVYRYCPECDQRIPLTADWRFMLHHVAPGVRCPGSLTTTPRPEARRNTHGSRWR
jgi:hypothetical protein